MKCYIYNSLTGDDNFLCVPSIVSPRGIAALFSLQYGMKLCLLTRSDPVNLVKKKHLHSYHKQTEIVSYQPLFFFI